MIPDDEDDIDDAEEEGGDVSSEDEESDNLFIFKYLRKLNICIVSVGYILQDTI